MRLYPAHVIVAVAIGLHAYCPEHGERCNRNAFLFLLVPFYSSILGQRRQLLSYDP